MKIFLLKLRRYILGKLVPEYFWPVSVNISGAMIPIRYEPFSFGTKWILKKNEYEGAEIALVNQVLKGGEHILEMGTSIGVLTRVMSNLVGPTGKIITVECNESLYKSCLRWKSHYPNVELVRGYGFPVYAIPENISIDGFSDDLGSLGTQVDFSVKQSAVKKNESIIDIQTVEQQFNFYPTILVIDVEGSEEIMLDTHFHLPSTIKCIIIELHGGLYKNQLESQDAIIQSIQKDGFALTKIISGSYLFERN